MEVKKEEKKANNVCIIGKNINEIIEKLDLNKDENENKLINEWNIVSYSKNNEQMENVFNKIIEDIKDMEEKLSYSTEIFSYTIVYSLDILEENEKNNVKTLLDKIKEKINSSYYQPFIILLVENQNDKEQIDLFLNSYYVNNFKIDKRNIESFITPLNIENCITPLTAITEKKEKYIELIKRKLLKIFAYFFEMGDEFKYKNINYKLYEEKNDNLYTINILVLGKTQVGKSTFINTLLKEKKAKEGGEGSSETKKQISYHIDNVPLDINDIEGFTGEETIGKVVNKIKSMQKLLEEKELHLVIYIMNSISDTYFNDNEYKIFEQLAKKLDTTQFLFICSKSKSKDNNSNIIKKIKNAFWKMIKKGLEQESQKDNDFNVLNYLYLCQKKDINYEEIIKEKKLNINNEEFNELNIYEKTQLKFDGYKEKKNKEMIDKIIDENNNLFFVNLKIDEDHNEIFGMDKVSKRIRKALKEIKNNNISFLNEKSKNIEEEKKKINEKIIYLSTIISENKDIKNFINNDDNTKTIRQNSYDETKSLLDKSINELDKIHKFNKNFCCLRLAIREKNYLEAKEYAMQLKEQFIESLKNDIFKYKIGGYVSGIIPFFDILIQHYIKKNAKEIIRKKFGDNLKDLNGKNDDLTEEEKNTLNEINQKSDDTISDVLKSLGRGVTLGINVAANILSKTILFPVGIVGCAIGMFVGGAVMNYDINAYLEFYGKRFVYKCLINLSFDSIDEYLKNNFEKNNNIDT